jgi:hypothetical protein
MSAPTYGSATADPGVGPQPSNGIVVSGEPHVQYLNVETSTAYFLPGRVVTKGTDDNDIAVCGLNGVPIGVLGYEHATKKDRPATRATVYATGAQAPVLKRGKGAIVLLYLAQSQTIVKGDKLVPAANGMVKKASAAIVPASTVAPVTSTSASPTMTGPIPTEGPIFATAEESVATTNLEGWIMAALER